MSPISNPQPSRSGAGWRTGQQHRVSTVVGSAVYSSSVTTVPLGSSVAQSAATLVLQAATRVPLDTAAAQSAATLTVQAGLGVVPLAPSTAQAAATLALTAQTRIALGAANAVSTASLAVTIYVPVVPGKFVLRNATVLVAGVDVSSRAHAVTFTQSREEIDITGYGDTYRVYLPGEASSTFVIEMFVDPVVLTPAVWSALEAGPVPVRVSSGPGAPTWIATACMVRESPLELQVGEAATATVELHSTGAVLQI